MTKLKLTRLLAAILLLGGLSLLTACGSKDEQPRERAAELCRYIPDHELLPQSAGFMTADFYNVLDTLFHHLPEHEAMDHEWLHYFVTSNGGTMADFEVAGVEQTDDAHAVATIKVRQKWEDGSLAAGADVEEHLLCMEKVGAQWLMSDFDGHKADCLRHIAIARREMALRAAMGDYLVREIGPYYRQGQLCVPTLLIVAEDSVSSRVWCDCWVEWYDVSGDTLKSVSGGNHSGCMTIAQHSAQPVVTSFEQTLDGAAFMPSARRIFDRHYDVFQAMHSNQDVYQAARQEQLRDYVKRHGLSARYYQDYGWPAVALD